MQSLRELYRIGMGPSSSHTMASRRAAEMFNATVPAAASFRVTLYGSLAATGKGHFTDRAILGVLGEDRTQIIWEAATVLPFHPNGMKFEALDNKGGLCREWTVFSVGGGALREEHETAEEKHVYSVADMSEILQWANDEGRPLWTLVQECEDSGIWDYLASVWKQMKQTMQQGLDNEDVLPGGLRLQRKALSVYRKAKSQRRNSSRTGLLSAYALAVSEQNAGCGVVVTAPTCGSCGVLPAVLFHLQKELKCPDTDILRALATAGLVGNVVKQNGSISGAEVGCQGEVGVACAMASAAASQLLGGTASQIEYAAEIGLEHFLGLTCDPVMGLVQIPCIERNVIAAAHALTAAEYVHYTDGRHRVSFDDAVSVMMQTGHDMPSLYRETSDGGLAKVVR
ncbi:MAG: L-serine ammonia-lyase, iron-sulfur-dependent, subunit alpha [Victivallales bacterium]|nr:L-serine ammonia-lyase, iron-sulfur-dependent, subunit alpha [Victivallales bacterium]